MKQIDVLYVEDDGSWGKIVGRWLEKRGLRMHWLQSRSELHDFLENCEDLPRCLLLDLTLNDSAGLSLCASIKSSPAYQHIPVVILTGGDVTSLECLQQHALYKVQKDPGTEFELTAVLDSVLSQQEKSRGNVIAGDLRLDTPSGQISRGDKLIARLTPGHFNGFLHLVRASPRPIGDEPLYASFLARHPYNKSDRDLTIRLIVRNYVSMLRRDLGSLIGSRIVRDGDEGYAYRPAVPLPRL